MNYHTDKTGPFFSLAGQQIGLIAVKASERSLIQLSWKNKLAGSLFNAWNFSLCASVNFKILFKKYPIRYRSVTMSIVSKKYPILFSEYRENISILSKSICIVSRKFLKTQSRSRYFCGRFLLHIFMTVFLFHKSTKQA